MERNIYKIGKELFITSDEEIKKDDYYLGDDNHIYCLCTTVNSNGKKIILTTNADYIEEGIQAIDDEFLEWFIENPSCEEVEVQKWFDGVDFLEYKIIIPQEEPKQKYTSDVNWESDIINKVWDEDEPLQELRKVCKCKRAYINPLSGICSLCWNEKFPDEKDDIKEEDLLKPKQETLEEFIRKSYLSRLEDCLSVDFEDGVKLGFKWQQERSYSEEDMINFAEYCKGDLMKTKDLFNEYQSIQQFKKK